MPFFKRLTYWHFVIGLTIIGAFLRLYNLPGTVQFLGDQGRDALVWYNLLVNRDPVFIGPVTSVGNMYLGPAYYYFMLPFYALSYPSPLGPAYGVALIGIASIPLLFWVGKQMFHERAAFLATVIFTFTWTFIYSSRFSWNPNPAPFFTILMTYGLWKAWNGKYWYWIFVSGCVSLLIQLHYMNLLAGGVAAIVWIISLWQLLKTQKRKSSQLKEFFVSTIGAIAIFVLSLTPLILFDIKNNYINARAFQGLLFGTEEHLGGSRGVWGILRETQGRGMHILFELTLNKLRWLNSLLLIGAIGAIAAHAFKLGGKSERKGVQILFIWLIVGIIGTSLYQSTVFDHYLSFLYPVTVFVIGLCLHWLLQRWMTSFLVVAFFVWFGWNNLTKYTFRSLDWSLEDMQRVSETLYPLIEVGEKYDLVLLAEHGDLEAMNYRYLLTITNKKPLARERFAEADKVIVINESKKVQDVTTTGIYQIITFPYDPHWQTISIPDGPDVVILKRKGE